MTTMDVVRSQLAAAQASIAAALALIGEEKPAPSAVCEHPQAKRVEMPVGGDPGQFMCRACHAIVSGIPAEAAP